MKIKMPTDVQINTKLFVLSPSRSMHKFLINAQFAMGNEIFMCECLSAMYTQYAIVQ